MRQFFAFAAIALCSPAFCDDGIHLAQGVMVGEVTPNSALVQTRLTATEGMDPSGDVPGRVGVVQLQFGTDPTFARHRQTPIERAQADRDFIVRFALDGLEPSTQYHGRVLFGGDESSLQTGPVCRFKTLGGADSGATTRFVMTSCMNYCKFMYGKSAKASGPVTATEQDKQLGYPAFEAIADLEPEFMIGAGDIVYYDNPIRTAKTLAEMRKCWHEQFRFPRMTKVFSSVPTFWSKDDHDFRYDDADLKPGRRPNADLGIDVFREQMPILSQGDVDSPTYRTVRVNQHVQLWFTEGRDFRSPNKMRDGPDKSLWGRAQRQWLQETLLASDATWKILVSPTPLVGPDDKRKTDNHANLGGFRHEANSFFDWLQENGIRNFVTFCGDRHWQFHSIHRSGVEEFACGALNDENSRRGVAPGDPRGTDPEGLVVQPFTYPEPSGGFLFVHGGQELTVEFRNDQGTLLHSVTKQPAVRQ